MENYSRRETVHQQTVDYLKQFSYADLKSFTNNFDTKIGSGGYGVVYKGEFPNGMQIAVKVLNEQYVAEDLFMDEVRIMGITYHHSLVKFFGYCSDANNKGLVYEYMENGSLDHILRNKDRCIEWDKLYDMMIETANGISYLHDKRIIHHDIKPANILLDSGFSPKVADFGLAKLINRDVTHVTVTLAKGTRGYVAPEMWTPISQVTHKCDVYSFGMMLLDVLGRCNKNQNEESFLKKVWKGYDKGQLDNIIEDCGIEKKHSERATVLSMIALWCAQYTPKTRPEMSDVVKMLKREIQVMNPPNPLLPSPDSAAHSSREVPEDEVSGKEIVDEIPTQSENEDLKTMEQQSVAADINFAVESSNNLAIYDFVSQHERDDIIVKCVMQDHGFTDRIPVAAILIYRCVLLWCEEYRLHTGPDPRTKFDHIKQMIVSAIGKAGKQYDHVFYWLSNTSMLLFFLGRGFKIRNTSFYQSYFWRMSRCFRPGSSHYHFNSRSYVANIVMYEQEVDFLHPAICFKFGMTSCTAKAYIVIRDKLKEELRSSLFLCIQAPTTESWRADWKTSIASSANNSHWHSIISTLNDFLRKFRDNWVPPYFTGKVFSQAFHYINVQLFNSLLTNQECCTLGYGEYVKAGLYELDNWCDIAKNYVDSSWAQLKHTRQAIEFLVTVNKSAISLTDITKSLCPGLNIPQLYRICRVYWDNENNTHGVASTVLDKMKKLWEDDRKNSVSGPLLLEDSSDCPLDLEDIFRFMGKMEFSYVSLDADIVKHPSYYFLR